MNNITDKDLIALQSYANELETFKSRVSKLCNELELGITSCSGYMVNANSKQALQKGRQVATDIKSCLSPVERLLEKVYRTIDDAEQYCDAEF